MGVESLEVTGISFSLLAPKETKQRRSAFFSIFREIERDLASSQDSLSRACGSMLRIGFLAAPP